MPWSWAWRWRVARRTAPIAPGFDAPAGDAELTVAFNVNGTTSYAGKPARYPGGGTGCGKTS